MVTAPAVAINVHTPKLIAHTRHAGQAGLAYASRIQCGWRVPAACGLARLHSVSTGSGASKHTQGRRYIHTSTRMPLRPWGAGGRILHSWVSFSFPPASRADNIIAGYEKCQGGSLADFVWLSCGGDLCLQLSALQSTVIASRF